MSTDFNQWNRGLSVEETHRRLSASWHLRLMQFLFSHWFVMKTWDRRDGRPYDKHGNLK